MSSKKIATAKTALIFGISGQDGAYLAQLLLNHGYLVHGTSRDKEITSFANLHHLNLFASITLHSAVLTDFRSVIEVIQHVQPDEIYNLAGQSSVALSFDQPVDTINGGIVGTLNILEAIRFLKIETRFYNAASSECYGNTEAGPATEATPFQPRSPYGVGKAAAFWAVANYRAAYGLYACSGILFNHESPLRPARYVTQKIVRGALDIADNKYQKLTLGTLSIARDWGWAPDYVDAMARMLQSSSPEDLIIATGETHTLEEFVKKVFSKVNLQWENHIEINKTLQRPSDIYYSAANPGRAREVLDWSAETKFDSLVSRLIEAELERRRFAG
ncbi:MAG: GDP-mannose 4,6-dehydratase [Alphaproteobacteria bacterium]|nr:GDP-mannose 4,6-dehydratase [Alphaproteobacteria bacterium]